jgi:hypothetical protein
MGISGSYNEGTVPYKAIFCGDIPLHRPYIGLIDDRYFHFRILKFPLTLATKHQLSPVYKVSNAASLRISHLPT